MKHNPHIDWEQKTVTLADKHIQQTTLSTELAVTTPQKEITLPPQYATYADVFAEQTFDELPPQ